MAAKVYPDGVFKGNDVCSDNSLFKYGETPEQALPTHPNGLWGSPLHGAYLASAQIEWAYTQGAKTVTIYFESALALPKELTRGRTGTKEDVAALAKTRYRFNVATVEILKARFKQKIDSNELKLLFSLVETDEEQQAWAKRNPKGIVVTYDSDIGSGRYGVRFLSPRGRDGLPPHSIIFDLPAGIKGVSR